MTFFMFILDFWSLTFDLGYMHKKVCAPVTISPILYVCYWMNIPVDLFPLYFYNELQSSQHLFMEHYWAQVLMLGHRGGSSFTSFQRCSMGLMELGLYAGHSISSASALCSEASSCWSRLGLDTLVPIQHVETFWEHFGEEAHTGVMVRGLHIFGNCFFLLPKVFLMKTDFCWLVHSKTTVHH